jgi:predicted RNA polymerase sigma factor
LPGKSSRRSRHSELPEQIALYEKARDSAARGDHLVAVRIIDDLLARFPATRLADEVELTRAESLARAGRSTAAAAAIERLLARGAYRGRRGELERMLGDLRLKQGDCDAARKAFESALAEELTERDRQAIRRGLARCDVAE